MGVVLCPAPAALRAFGAVLLALGEEDAICRLDFLRDATHPDALLARWRAAWPETRFVEAKTPRLPACPRLLLVGTPFQQRVWGALLALGRGETISYGDLAWRLGAPRAARAVGAALGANPVPLFVPCHRVLGRQGLGGYSGGLALKKALLEAEGVRL